jgi:hypothetical protein
MKHFKIVKIERDPNSDQFAHFIGDYKIDHIPSGYWVAIYETKGEAQFVAEQLDSINGVETIKAVDLINPSFDVFSILQQIQDKVRQLPYEYEKQLQPKAKT